jgi:hypothetical protein
MRRSDEPPGDDDPDLFAAMALSYRKPELAQAAWSTLYPRHGAWLEEHVERATA